MRLGRMRRLAAGAVIVGALVPAGAGAANACDGGHHDRVAAAAYTMKHHFGHHHLRGVLAVASHYLGLSRATIVAQLKDGKSLGDIANATAGKSASGLVDAYTAALKTRLDHWVAEGKISPAQETAIIARVQPWLVKLVDARWTGEHKR